MSSDQYCFMHGWWAGTLKANIAIFNNDLLDRGDQLMQFPDNPVSESNPILTIRSSPRSDGIAYMYSVRLFPEDVHIDDLSTGAIWTLTKESDASSDPLSLDIEF